MIVELPGSNLNYDADLTSRVIGFTANMTEVVRLLNSNGEFPADYTEHSLWDAYHLPGLIAEQESLLNRTNQLGLLAQWELEKEIFPLRTIVETKIGIEQRLSEYRERYNQATWELGLGKCIVRFRIVLPGAPLHHYHSYPESWTLDNITFTGPDSLQDHILGILNKADEQSIEVRDKPTRNPDKPFDIEMNVRLVFTSKL